MELGLIKVGDISITPQGSLYLERLSDTLHRVTRYHMNLIDGSERVLTYKEYKLFNLTIQDPNKRFIQLHAGELIAVNQVRNVKPITSIVDTRKEEL